MDGRGAPETIFRMAELERVTGYKAPTIWEKVREGSFPKPIKLGGRATGWLGSEVAAWQRARIAERDGKEAA